MARWRNDPRGGTDHLYDETADEVATKPSTVRTFLLGYLTVIACLLMAAPLYFGLTLFVQATDNLMAGYGFTPVTHVQPIAPASFTPASVTWTLPGEVAQP